jgi:hypothetical protein
MSNLTVRIQPCRKLKRKKFASSIVSVSVFWAKWNYTPRIHLILAKSHPEVRHESAYGYEWKQQECKRQSLLPEDTIPVDFAKRIGIVATL